MKEVDAFMRLHHLHFEQVSGEERREFASELKEVYRANRRDNMTEDRHYFKVPFEQAIGLMQRRQIFLNQGYAYVPRKNLIELLRLQFRENLSRSLSVAFKSFPKIANDTRLAPLVKNLSRQYMGRDFGSSNDGAMLSNLKAEQIGTFDIRTLFNFFIVNIFPSLRYSCQTFVSSLYVKSSSSTRSTTSSQAFRKNAIRFVSQGYRTQFGRSHAFLEERVHEEDDSRRFRQGLRLQHSTQLR